MASPAVSPAGAYGDRLLRLVAGPAAVNLHAHVLGEFQTAPGIEKLDMGGAFPVAGEVPAIPLDIDPQPVAPEMFRVDGQRNGRQADLVVDKVGASHHVAGEKPFGDRDRSQDRRGFDADPDPAVTPLPRRDAAVGREVDAGFGIGVAQGNGERMAVAAALVRESWSLRMVALSLRSVLPPRGGLVHEGPGFSVRHPSPGNVGPQGAECHRIDERGAVGSEQPQLLPVRREPEIQMEPRLVAGLRPPTAGGIRRRGSWWPCGHRWGTGRPPDRRGRR